MNDHKISNTVPTFAAVFIVAGHTRRMTYQATDLAEATALAAKWGAGVTGEVVEQRGEALPLPTAYSWREAARQLGGVSRSQIYTWLTQGLLKRLPSTRRVLITRESVEQMRPAGSWRSLRRPDCAHGASGRKSVGQGPRRPHAPATC
jgi:hypothetical protein